MRRLFVALAAGAIGCLATGCEESPTLALARNGATPYVLVTPETLQKGERFVVDDFKALFEQGSGAKLAEATARTAPAAKRIFFGIAPTGLDRASLKDQEYVITRRGDDIYLVGGGANGNRYAAYQFLEKTLGYRFWDVRGNVGCPDRTKFAAVTVVETRRSPSFKNRYMNGGTGYYNRPTATKFVYRNGQNAHYSADAARNDGIELTPDDFRTVGPHAHSIPYYIPASRKDRTFDFIRKGETEDLFKAHPEYFTKNREGQPTVGAQICFSEPGLRKLLGERVLENMRLNPDGNIFDCSASDVPGEFCYCAGCQALTKKYGAVSGPLVDFVREFAPKVERLYPKNRLMCLVYRKNQTQPPPKGVDRLPGSFMPDFAPIDDNFAKDWTHPDNRQTYADLKEWCRLCKDVTVWYYPNPYTGAVTPPLGNVARVTEDIRLMHEAGVNGHLMEHNVGVGLLLGFTELQSYVIIHQLFDVDADVQALAAEFIEHQYGAAAVGFTAYWRELEDIRKKEEMFLSWNAAPSAYRHLTPERLMRWEDDFDRMEALVRDDPERLYNLQRVRINLDYAVATRYSEIRKAGDKRLKPYDFYADRALAVMDRAVADFATGRYKGRGASARKAFKDSLTYYRSQSIEAKIPLPKELFGSIPADQLFTFLPTVAGHDYLPDEKAAFGFTAWYDNNGRGGLKLPQQFDLEDHTKLPPHHYTRGVGVITAKDLGPRGEYKWYYGGESVVSPDCTFRLGVSDGWDIKARVGNTWKFGSYNKVKFYASLKFEGPAYYPEDAGKPNRISCDRIVAVTSAD